MIKITIKIKIIKILMIIKKIQERNQDSTPTPPLMVLTLAGAEHVSDSKLFTVSV